MASRPVTRQQTHRPPSTVACEACRKLKMRCVRPSQSEGSIMPCDRCRRNGRTCSIPPSRPLGRRPGAVGRYQGLEKAYHQMKTHLKREHTSRNSVGEVGNVQNAEKQVFDLLRSKMQSNEDQSYRPIDAKVATTQDKPRSPVVTESNAMQQAGMASHVINDPVSNPLALLVAASGAMHSESIPNTPVSNAESAHEGQSPSSTSIANRMLNRPGHLSLGLQLSEESLQSGLDALFTTPTSNHKCTDYFRSSDDGPPRDIGPDLDPVELGLISMEEAYHLFSIYFMRLHRVNGILDPKLHTVDYVRSKSALLFTWMLALTAQFDHGSAAIAKRLRLHGEKLSRHVHTSGFKSVEIVQGYYISLLSATPARMLSEERSWLYTMYAFGVAAELGLDQTSPSYASNDVNLTPNCTPRSPTNCDREDRIHIQRLVRNRERTWLRILLWERANSGASGRMNAIPENDLTCNIERWWMHPLADSTDKHTVAFIILRRHLAFLHAELQRQTGMSHANPHWVRDLIDATLEPWRKTWIYTIAPSAEPLPDVHLHHVYLHNRLWTLSFALQASISSNHDLNIMREDCFQAAVHCCEVAVHDLQQIGEQLYCMLAPTWAMISYTAILALKLFQYVYQGRPGGEIELLALLAQVALQLERAGTTPSHRFGIAAILGQQLLMILRTRAAGLASTTSVTENDHDGNSNSTQIPSNRLSGERSLNTSSTADMPPDIHLQDPLLSPYDPYLTTSTLGMDNDVMGDGFADLFREIFGPSFGEVF
ncbi:hypothetical protein ABOM_001687 [Aspergillus bombycis]|uniref:Zn(2)-C6 fungal-type domain-containing protein n=1 Tax=Aspergillus bombycis TaxID=109264 RepID=A0A1F8ACQ2_9EURO|nr:hypothetical protein ABOM_001687 [Aspergillus bombycis]OGM49536.1 hypothetical protein ABOM_001687 [Aspergillus bombycis]